MAKNKSFFNSVTSDNYRIQIDIWQKAYNISHEKVELFRDFLLSLYELIDTTYLGPDVTEKDVDQKNHFNWCWNKIIDDFNNERIYFKNKGEHHNYFWNFFYEAFYYKNNVGLPVKIKEYIGILFDFEHKKSRSEIDFLTEWYKLLNQSLKK